MNYDIKLARPFVFFFFFFFPFFMMKKSSWNHNIHPGSIQILISSAT